MRRAALVLPLALCLALGLAACSGASEEERSSPSVSAPALAFADQFDLYNETGDCRDFTISAGELEGQPCYRLDSGEHGVTVLVPEKSPEHGEEVQAVVEHQGKRTSFAMPVFLLGHGGVSGTASLSLADLTGDGTLDLVYIYGGGGTGVWNDQVKVIDLAAMEERPICWDSDSVAEWMSGLIRLQLVGTREAGDLEEQREAVYQVTAPDGTAIYAGTGGFSLTEFPDTPSPIFGNYESIALEGDRLALNSSFWLDLGVGVFGPYLGSLTCDFRYDPAQRSFTLSPECALQVDVPVDPSAVAALRG